MSRKFIWTRDTKCLLDCPVRISLWQVCKTNVVSLAYACAPWFVHCIHVYENLVGSIRCVWNLRLVFPSDPFHLVRAHFVHKISKASTQSYLRKNNSSTLDSWRNRWLRLYSNNYKVKYFKHFKLTNLRLVTFERIISLSTPHCRIEKNEKRKKSMKSFEEGRWRR